MLTDSLKKLCLSALTITFLAGCSGGSDSDGSTTKSEGKDKITVFTWAEYLNPDTLAEFSAETGIDVVYEVFNTAGEMEGRLRSEPGQFDLVIVDDSIVTQLHELDLLRDIDHSLIPNLANIAPKYREMPFDNGNQFSVPYLWGTTLVAYRQDKISDTPKSWGLLFGSDSPAKSKLLDEPVQLFSTLFAYAGADTASLDPELFSEQADLLCSRIGTGVVGFGGDEDVKAALRSGNVDAAMCYSTDAAMLADEDERIGYFIPDEGAPLWIDNFVIPRDTQNFTGVHKFINFMLTPEAGAAASNYTWCASPNAAATPLIDPEILNDDRIFPSEETTQKCFFLPAMNSERQNLTNAGFFTIRNALRELPTSAVERTSGKNASND